MDFANPNNLLVDTKAKEFHLIDLLSGRGHNIVAEISQKLDGVTSGVYEMTDLLLDLKFQSYFADKMTPKEKLETKMISEKIIKNVRSAAAKEGLGDDLELIKARLDFCASDTIKGFPNRYTECLNSYSYLFENCKTA